MHVYGHVCQTATPMVCTQTCLTHAACMHVYGRHGLDECAHATSLPIHVTPTTQVEKDLVMQIRPRQRFKGHPKGQKDLQHLLWLAKKAPEPVDPDAPADRDLDDRDSFERAFKSITSLVSRSRRASATGCDESCDTNSGSCDGGCDYCSSSCDGGCDSGYYSCDYGCDSCGGSCDYSCDGNPSSCDGGCDECGSKPTCKAGEYISGCTGSTNGWACPTCTNLKCPYVNQDRTGTCSGATNGYKCECKAGFSGNECQYSDAINCNGLGAVQPDGSCTCKEGYIGKKCEYKSDPAHCNNLGVVLDDGTCKCSAGVSGRYCQCVAPDDKTGECMQCAQTQDTYTGKKCEVGTIKECNGRALGNAKPRGEQQEDEVKAPPRGVQYNVASSMLKHCTIWYDKPYSHGTRSSEILNAPNAKWLFVAAKYGSIIKLGAFGERAAVLKQTSKNTPHENNGVWWYRTPGESFGFAGSSHISQNSADTVSGAHRLSWHLGGSSGYRAGDSKSLSSSSWQKQIYSCGGVSAKTGGNVECGKGNGNCVGATLKDGGIYFEFAGSQTQSVRFYYRSKGSNSWSSHNSPSFASDSCTWSSSEWSLSNSNYDLRFSIDGAYSEITDTSKGKVKGTACRKSARDIGDYCLPCSDGKSVGDFCQYTKVATCYDRGTPLFSGKCEKCNYNTAGPNCQYTKEATCNGNGTPLGTGKCECDDGYTAASNCKVCETKVTGKGDDGTCSECKPQFWSETYPR